MFKANGRISIITKGVIEGVAPEDNGAVAVTVDGVGYIVSNSKLIDKCKMSIGKEVKLEGYSSLGKLYASFIE